MWTIANQKCGSINKFLWRSSLSNLDYLQNNWNNSVILHDNRNISVILPDNQNISVTLLILLKKKKKKKLLQETYMLLLLTIFSFIEFLVWYSNISISFINSRI